MSEFVRNPLLRNLNRDNPMSRLENLESGAGAGPSAFVEDINELSFSNVGTDYAITGPTGLYRLVMSGTNMLDELGIHANFAGFDDDGIPQFWMSADDGSIVAGGGAVIMDGDGITLPEAGDAMLLTTSTFDSIISQVTNPSTGHKALNFLVYNAPTTEILTNGDFSDQLTGWTESDAGTNINVDSDEYYSSPYSIRFTGAVSSTDYIEQTFSSKTYGLVVRFRAKVSAASCTVVLEGSAGTRTFNELTTNGEWRTFYGILYGATTLFRLRISNSGGNTVWIDDVSVRELSGVGTIPHASNYSLGPHVMQITTPIFEFENIANESIFKYNVADGRVTVNDDGADIDTVIKDDAGAAALKVDAGAHEVQVYGVAIAGGSSTPPALKIILNRSFT